MQENSGPSIGRPCPIAHTGDPERRDEGTLDAGKQEEHRPRDGDGGHRQGRPEREVAERYKEGYCHEERTERQDGQLGRAIIGANAAKRFAAMIARIGLFQVSPENPPLPAFGTPKSKPSPYGGHQAWFLVLRRRVTRHARIRPIGGGLLRPLLRDPQGGCRQASRPAHAAGSAFR